VLEGCRYGGRVETVAHTQVYRGTGVGGEIRGKRSLFRKTMGRNLDFPRTHLSVLPSNVTFSVCFFAKERKAQGFAVFMQ
jgi:hypothetical protein